MRRARRPTRLPSGILLVVASTLFLLLLQPGVLHAGAPGALVATRRLEARSYEVTLPEKVGLLQAGEHRVLSFQVAGRLALVAAEGDAVDAGGGVASLDPALEKAQLRQADLRLAESRSEHARIRGLRESQAASDKALESARTTLELRRSEREVARDHLTRRTLLAPVAGIVSEVRVDPGEVVSPGQPVAMLMSLDPLRLEVGVPGYQVGRVRLGAAVEIEVPAHPEERFKGTVHRVAAAAAEGRHLFEVEIRVPNPGGRLRPGMSGRARILTESLDAVLPVPLDLAVERGGRRVVFFVDSGRAREVPVDSVVLHGNRLLLSGEIPFRELVVRGQRDLREGMAVRVDNRVLPGAEDGAP